MDLVLMKTRRTVTSGFSLVETLIAAVLLGVIIVGLVPLFMRSIVDNVSGRESSRASALTLTEVEELNALPLDRPSLTVVPGSTSFECYAAWNEAGGHWDTEQCPPPTTTGDELWKRRTTVRQYSVRTLDPGFDATPNELDNPLDGAIPPQFVHLREIMIEVEGGRRPAPARQLDLSVVRGF